MVGRYPRRMALAAASLAAGALLYATTTPGERRPATKAVGATAEATVAPSPSIPSPELPDAGPQPLEGAGPFVVYSVQGPKGDARIYAADLADEQRSPIFLGRIDEPVGGISTHGEGHLVAIASYDTLFVVGRGDRLRDHVTHFNLGLRAVAVSPDGRRVALAQSVDQFSVRIVIASVDAMEDRKRITQFRTSSDEMGGSFEIFWNSADTLSVIDGCHCDGGAGYASLFRLSIAGERSELDLLGDRVPYWAGPQEGGWRMAYDDVPNVDCFEREGACDALPHTLTVADIRDGTVRRLARRIDVNFGVPVLSPSGSFVAAAAWGADTIEIYDVRRREKESEASYWAAGVVPVAWLDDRHLIAVASSPDFIGERETGRLLLIERAGSTEYVEPRPLANGVSLHYLGWVR